MTDAIKPALTPEEWAVQLDGNAVVFDSYHVQLQRMGRDEFEIGVPLLDEGHIGVTYDSAVCSQLVNERDRHALAALALHGQPFGFTRDDVDLLREEARLNRERGQRLTADYVDELAARIEALLPPEPK